MKIGLFTDSLADLEFEHSLDWVVDNGIEAVEIGTGNFSPAPHFDREANLASAERREGFIEAIEARGLSLSALNCNGNPLDPDPERQQNSQNTLRQTIELMGMLGGGTVVTMSGCPGDLGGGTYPNWVTCSWQREYVELVDRQWDEAVVPFWGEIGQLAREHGVRIAIEMHPGQWVYNTRTLLRLRQLVGPETLGANLDPSHLFFQNMDPITVVKALGEGGVFHTHAKDTRINRNEMALNGSLDTRPMATPGERAWEYVTLGFGHGEAFWRDFLAALRMGGYDGVISIEHEDRLMSAKEGIRKSVEFLRPLLPRTMPEAG